MVDATNSRVSLLFNFFFVSFFHGMFGALLDSRTLKFINDYNCIETFKTVQSTVCSPCVLVFIALSYVFFLIVWLVCIKHFEDSAVKFVKTC